MASAMGESASSRSEAARALGAILAALRGACSVAGEELQRAVGAVGRSSQPQARAFLDALRAAQRSLQACPHAGVEIDAEEGVAASVGALAGAVVAVCGGSCGLGSVVAECQRARHILLRVTSKVEGAAAAAAATSASAGAAAPGLQDGQQPQRAQHEQQGVEHAPALTLGDLLERLTGAVVGLLESVQEERGRAAGQVFHLEEDNKLLHRQVGEGAGLHASSETRQV
jgi:hypothetical protein